MDNKDFTEYVVPFLELVSSRFKVLHLRAKSAMEISDKDLYVGLLVEKANLLTGLPLLLPKQLDGCDEVHWEGVLRNIEFFAKKARDAMKSGETSILAGLLLDPGKIDIEDNWLERIVNDLKGVLG